MNGSVGAWQMSSHAYRAYDEQLQLQVASGCRKFAKAVGHLAASIESYTDLLHRKELERSFRLPPGVDPEAEWRGYAH